ncbi:hypothetical protein ATI61_12267 [Archangium gephyra]|uniref:STAS/SEC14 domain-containing protein n=1 Tax=Archangium gephyra TaxID=48 RepID=A0AAC8Q066_9BACT|nr:hypothetical protein [Archangium gephyra]AKI98535.1 Hypothetical protein AA314_00162 [Archangium gephyra]REG20367.1 hypothetical protein ATI61_12267 [Archangium gephyra]
MILFEDTLWPLLHLKFVGEHTPAQYEEYLTRLEKSLRRPEPCLVIIDTNVAQSVPLSHCRRQAEWCREHEALVREKVLGVAFVVNSTLARLSLNVVVQLAPMPVPYTFVSHARAAAEWAAERFSDRGLLQPSVRVRQHFGLRPVTVAAAAPWQRPVPG